MISYAVSGIVRGLLQGDKRSIARAISIIDNNEADSQVIIQGIFNKTGNAKTVGFTGSAGAGKSTLIGKLIPQFQSLGYSVAILAVDPTSPVSGGAILGDRVRMQRVASDDRVFMRSVASRGSIGGISKSLRNIVRVLDAAGYDLILIESVGAGQAQVEISRVVDLTAVLYTPYAGDNIQNVKAGLTEVGDLYVVNKADLEGAGLLFNSILDFVGDTQKKPVVLKVSARTGKGIKEIAATIDKMIKEMTANQNEKEKEKKKLELELRDMVLNMIEEKASAMLDQNSKYYDFVDKLVNKKIDPFLAAEELTRSISW
jgi:LAO/AO transport system kinase